MATHDNSSGSPIGIDGGGSVTIDFGHRFYDCDCGKKANPHTHINPKAQISRVEITGYEPIHIKGKKVKIRIFLQDQIS